MTDRDPRGAMPAELVGATEGAAIVGARPGALREWARRGLVRGVRLPSGHWRFNRAELERIRAELERLTRPLIEDEETQAPPKTAVSEVLAHD